MSGPRKDNQTDDTDDETGIPAGVLGTGAGAIAAGYLIRDKIKRDRRLREWGGPYADPQNWTPGKSNPYAPVYKQPLIDLPGVSPFNAEGKLRPHAYSLQNVVRPSSRPTKPPIDIPEKR